MLIKRLRKLIIWSLIAVIFSGGVLGLLSFPQKAKAAEVLDAEKFFSGDPAYKPDIYNLVTFKNQSLSKNGANLEHIFRAHTTGERGFQFDATFKQIYDKTNETLFYYQWTESHYNVAGVLESKTIYFAGRDGFQNYSQNYPIKIEVKKLLALDTYRMKNHPTYFLITKQETTESYGIVYKESDRYPLAEGNTDNGLGAYIKWYNIYYSYNSTSQSNIEKIFGAGTYEICSISGSGNKWIDHGTNAAPQILIKGNPDLSRPDLTFTLTHVMGRSGALTSDDNYFFFTTDNPDFKTTALRITQSGNGVIVWDTNSKSWDEVNPINDRNVKVCEDIWWKYIINRAFNAKASSGEPGACGNVTNAGETASPEYSKGTEPPRQCINASTNGWLSKWGVTFNKTSLTNPTGEETCGISVFQGPVKSAIAKVLCIILRGIGEAAGWMIQSIFGTVFDAYHPPNTQSVNASAINPFIVQTAYADYPKPDASSIKQALGDQDGWVLTSWKVILGLADVFVVIILLFLAITNILHIQYDTYTIKKTLPTLIVGIILANFSIFITKMLVDAANVITATFMGGKAGDGVEKLITAIIPIGTGTFMESTPSVGALILAILFGFFALIAFAILGFLFYIRYAVILTLTVAAPLAFVLMAFPPTQGLFKQWWGWYSKFIFMKPVSLFLVWLATLVLEKSGGAGITVWAIATFLVCAAIIVPFKLGGAIMGAWGKAGKWLASPATNAARGRYDRFRRDAGTFAVNRLPLVGRIIGGAANKEEFSKREREIALARQKRLSDERRGGHYTRGKLREETEQKRGQLHEENVREATPTYITENAELEKELERAKNRVEARKIRAQQAIYTGNRANELQTEILELENAKGDLKLNLDEAELRVRRRLGLGQKMRELERKYAENEIEHFKGDLEAQIREGRLDNLSDTQSRALIAANIAPGTGVITAIDLKSRYLEQENRLTMLKERLAKRAGQDIQVIAERDLRANNDLRQTQQELLTAGFGVDSNYNLDGTMIAGGGTARITWVQAVEAAEELRYRATTAQGPERARLETAAAHFEDIGRAHQQTNATYSQNMIQALDTQAINYEAQANAAATPEERARFQAQADQMMQASQNVRAHLGQNVEYDNYLSNNLAGRRQKIINPDIASEVEVQIMSNSPQELIEQIAEGHVGTGEARATTEDVMHGLRGEMNLLDESAARAFLVQLGAMHRIMLTGVHGETKGLQEIDGFLGLMHNAGRENFKVAVAQRTFNTMPEAMQLEFRREMARRYNNINLTDWRAMSDADRTNIQNSLTDDQFRASIETLDFSSLQTKGQGRDVAAQRDFVDRFMDQVAEDKGLMFSSSAGSRMGRTRPVAENELTENLP